MVMLMPKKTAKTDRRKDRYSPLTEDDVRRFSDRLHNIAGELLAIADEMAEKEIEQIKFDGRVGLEDAIDLVAGFVSFSKGYVVSASTEL
jgi:hypothetical protein